MDQQQKHTILPAGTILDDRFEIKQFLGAGSFGAVYRAKQLVFGHAIRDVALKLFKADKVTPHNVYEVFADALTLIGLIEAEKCPRDVAQRLIQIYDVGLLKQPASQAYITMKLVPSGKTLQSAVKRWRGAGGMKVETAVRFLRQMLVPLAWMHTLENAAVHGDLKPDNVLMTDDSELVLTDFGLAGRLPLGAVGGAMLYQAPETLLGNVGETAADMYGVGLVWYEMLTGRHPFQDVGLEALAASDDKAYVQAQHEARKWAMRAADQNRKSEADLRIVPPSELNEEMKEHPQLEAMLRRCLAFRQFDRYVNARLLLADIDRYVSTGVAGPMPTTEPAEQRTPNPSQKSRDAMVQDAQTLLDNGQADKAATQAEAVMRQHPKFMPALLVLARAQTKNRETDRARATCAAAQQLDRNDPAPLEVLAEVFQAEGKPSIASTLRLQAAQLRGKRKP